MSSVPLLYRLAVRAMRRSAPLLSVGGSKVARGIRGRRSALGTLERWGREQRDPTRPTVWVHAPSVGEGLQAGAVLRALERRRPGMQLVFTHFSPSAEGLGPRLGADVSAYLPWDVSDAAQRALSALRPSLLVFTKTEVWPVLVDAAVERSVPVAIVGATVREGAGRTRWPARAALRPTWGRLGLACAVGSEDAERLVRLGADPAVVHVTGDPGIDAAAHRASTAEPAAPYLAPFLAAQRPVVVAGSTWPADEHVLLPAWVGTRAAHADALLVVAPHEPSPEGTEALLSRFRGSGLSSVTIGSVERRGSLEGVDVVIVDRVGILAHLYTVGSLAFVGGGFGRNGLHSVLEPAAAGVPVLVGPRYGSSPAAGDLIRLGAARAIEDASSLEDALRVWLRDATAKSRAGGGALDYIGAHLGAAERTAVLLDHLMMNQDAE